MPEELLTGFSAARRSSCPLCSRDHRRHRLRTVPQLTFPRSVLSAAADHLADECRESPDGGHHSRRSLLPNRLLWIKGGAFGARTRTAGRRRGAVLAGSRQQDASSSRDPIATSGVLASDRRLAPWPLDRRATTTRIKSARGVRTDRQADSCRAPRWPGLAAIGGRARCCNSQPGECICWSTPTPLKAHRCSSAQDCRHWRPGSRRSCLAG
jgi:hypothetical protein